MDESSDNIETLEGVWSLHCPGVPCNFNRRVNLSGLTKYGHLRNVRHAHCMFAHVRAYVASLGSRRCWFIYWMREHPTQEGAFMNEPPKKCQFPGLHTAIFKMAPLHFSSQMGPLFQHEFYQICPKMEAHKPSSWYWPIFTQSHHFFEANSLLFQKKLWGHTWW